MKIKIVGPTIRLNNKMWETSLSTTLEWVTVGNNNFLVFCYSNGTIDVIDFKTGKKTVFRK